VEYLYASNAWEQRDSYGLGGDTLLYGGTQHGVQTGGGGRREALVKPV